MELENKKLEYQRQYRIMNRDKVLEANKKYRDENKDKISHIKEIVPIKKEATEVILDLKEKYSLSYNQFLELFNTIIKINQHVNVRVFKK